ncbi:hypothetical protein [Bifidobacterium oedipodis]|nr:hypothetical protein [Bifidobacterium sp. DSM 109957]
MDPRGMYYLFDGDSAVASIMSNRLREQGYEVSIKTNYVGSFAQWFFSKPFGVGLIIALMLCVMLSGCFALMNAKGYAIERLHGKSALGIVFRDIKANAVPCAAGMAVACAVLCGAVYIYNHGAQWNLWLMVTALILLLIMACMMVAYLVGFAIASASPLLWSIKGRLPQRLPSVAVYCVRIPAVVVTIWAISFAGTALAEARDQWRTQQAWRTAGDSAAIYLNPNLSAEEQDQYSERTGAWLRQAEADGHMILAHEYDLRFFAPPADDGSTVSGRLLLANGNYLSHQDVRDADGSRLTSVPDDAVLVVVPSTLDDAHQQERLDAVHRWVKSQCEMYGRNVPQINIVRGASSQQLFGYGSALPNTPTLFDDALLVVINASSGLLSDDDYTAYASQGDVLLSDTNYAIASSRQAGLGDFIFAVGNVAQNAADDYAQLKADLIVHLFNIITCAAILAVSSIAIAQIRVRERAQTIFARYIHGWSFPRTHMSLIVMETLLAILPLLWSLWQVASMMRSQAAPGQDNPLLLGGWQPVLVMLLAVINLTICLLGVAHYTAGIVRNHAREE